MTENIHDLLIGRNIKSENSLIKVLFHGERLLMPLQILSITISIFRCAVASLYEVVSVRRSVRRSVRMSRVFFSKVKITHTRRILCRVSGLVYPYMQVVKARPKFIRVGPGEWKKEEEAKVRLPRLVL